MLPVSGSSVGKKEAPGKEGMALVFLTLPFDPIFYVLKYSWIIFVRVYRSVACKQQNDVIVHGYTKTTEKGLCGVPSYMCGPFATPSKTIDIEQPVYCLLFFI